MNANSHVVSSFSKSWRLTQRHQREAEVISGLPKIVIHEGDNDNWIEVVPTSRDLTGWIFKGGSSLC